MGGSQVFTLQSRWVHPRLKPSAFLLYTGDFTHNGIVSEIAILQQLLLNTPLKFALSNCFTYSVRRNSALLTYRPCPSR